MRHIQPPKVTISSPAQVIGIDLVRADCADGCRTDDVSGAIVMGARLVEVAMETQLGRVPFPEEVLPIDIGDQNALVPFVERVQVRKRVLFSHVEAGEVVLEAVIVGVAKEAHGGIDVIKDETSEITVEDLISRTNGDEVVVIRQIRKMHFAERFLES